MLAGRPITWKPVNKGGDASFIGVGIPMFQGEGSFTKEELEASALATRGWWHHSIECTLDKVDFKYIQSHLEVYASYLWELCTAPVLPFTYQPVAEQIVKRLDELRAPADCLRIDGLKSAAQQLLEAAQRFDALAAEASRRHAAGKGDDGEARRLNTAMKRVSRILGSSAAELVGRQVRARPVQLHAAIEADTVAARERDGGAAAAGRRPLDARDAAHARAQSRIRCDRRGGRRVRPGHRHELIPGRGAVRRRR